MNQSISLVSLVVRDYEEAVEFFVGKLGFALIEDSYVPAQDKRWVVIAPHGDGNCRILLARASSEAQKARIGSQTGGRVFLFLSTDDFWRDYEAYKAKGIEFVRLPKEESYGTVAVFKDVCGNLWDLVQPKKEPNSEGSTLRVLLRRARSGTPVEQARSTSSGLQARIEQGLSRAAAYADCIGRRELAASAECPC